MIGRQGNGLRLKVSIFPQVVGSSFSSDILSVDHGYMFRYGSLCLRPLDNGRSLWSLGWTTGEANIWWKKWTFFRAGVSREHRVESPIYVLFNPWLPEDPTHMPRFSIVKIFTANCFQWEREGWVPDGGGGKDLRRDSFETSRRIFSRSKFIISEVDMFDVYDVVGYKSDFPTS